MTTRRRKRIYLPKKNPNDLCGIMEVGFSGIIALSHWCKAMHPVAMLAGNNEVGNFNNVVDNFILFVLCEKN